MPQCTRPRRPPRGSSAPWVSLRSRSLGARLRSHVTKRLVAAPRQTIKRRPRNRKRKAGRRPSSLALSGSEDQSFLCGHAFEVLFALGLVPSQRRLLQVDSSPSRARSALTPILIVYNYKAVILHICHNTFLQIYISLPWILDVPKACLINIGLSIKK